MKSLYRYLSLTLLIGQMLYLQSAEAFEDNDKQQLKQEIIQELLKGNELKQLVREEIKQIERNSRGKNTLDSEQIEKRLRPVAIEQDHVYGNADALISVVEFADFDCPFCRKIHPVLKRLVDDSDGKVNWAFRYFPLSMHKPNVQKESEVAECVAKLGGNVEFWKFTNALFLQPRRNVQDIAILIDHALNGLELEKEDVMACVDSGQVKEKVENDEKEALSLGVQGTPASILINRKTGKVAFRQGAVSMETLASDVKNLSESGN